MYWPTGHLDFRIFSFSLSVTNWHFIIAILSAVQVWILYRQFIMDKLLIYCNPYSCASMDPVLSVYDGHYGR